MCCKGGWDSSTMPLLTRKETIRGDNNEVRRARVADHPVSSNIKIIHYRAMVFNLFLCRFNLGSRPKSFDVTENFRLEIEKLPRFFNFLHLLACSHESNDKRKLSKVCSFCFWDLKPSSFGKAQEKKDTFRWVVGHPVNSRSIVPKFFSFKDEIFMGDSRIMGFMTFQK